MPQPTTRIRHPHLGLVGICLALCLVTLNTTATNTALPAIGNEYHVSASLLQWIVSVYMLSCAAFVVAGGQLGDIFGRRKLFLFGGVACFAAASVIIGLAETAEVVVAGRILQGFGAAFIIPGSMSLVGSLFPPERRGWAMGIWSATAALGFALGPIIGGVLTESLGWKWVWWSNLPLLAVSAGILIGAVPESRDQGRARTVDLLGIITLAVGLFLLVFVLDQSQVWGLLSAATVGTLAGALGFLLLFAYIERRHRSPLIHARILRDRIFVASNALTFLVNWLLLAILLILNLYLQNYLLLGYSAIEAGLALVPMNLIVFGLALKSGALMKRTSVQRLSAAGFLALIGGFVLLSTIKTGEGYGSYVPAFVLLGIGFGLNFSSVSAVGMARVPESSVGEASGLINMSRYLGAAFGVTLSMAMYIAGAKEVLNDLLASYGVSRAEDLQLDGILTGTKATAEHVLGGVMPAVRADALHDAREAVTSAFTSTMRLSAGVAIVGLVATLWLLRDKSGRPV